MRRFYFIWILLFSLSALGQQEGAVADEGTDPIETLKARYAESLQLKCSVRVHIAVEGMQIPDKEIYLEYQKGQKPIVRGKGLTLLPKKGGLRQFQTLFSGNIQQIALPSEDGLLRYKLVALDPKSDWITADLWLAPGSYQILRTEVSTKSHGSFSTENSYEEAELPVETIISFEVKAFKLPLKFIGGSQSEFKKQKLEEGQMGKVVLRYAYLP